MLGGLAMGMPRKSIEDQMHNVVEFSGLGDAMGRPMDTYSSGMRARLAFSIATLRVPDVLLIDEALAVGDKKFRERSLQRINEIRETCSRAVWLEHGTLMADGGVEEVLSLYEDRVS